MRLRLCAGVSVWSFDMWFTRMLSSINGTISEMLLGSWQFFSSLANSFFSAEASSLKRSLSLIL